MREVRVAEQFDSCVCHAVSDEQRRGRPDEQVRYRPAGRAEGKS
jgi:hypothetical protein